MRGVPEEIYGLAARVFGGDRQAANDWLSKPNIALGDQVPMIFCRKPKGRALVTNVLSAIEHGVYL